MQVRFQVTVSKSAIDRWVEEVADALPSEDERGKLLYRQKPIPQGHVDELFPRGTPSCLVVLKEEPGRIVAAQEVEKRDEEHVRPFRERLNRLGLDLKPCSIDHWQASANAIQAVCPQASLQRDSFHLLPTLGRQVWGEFRAHRRDLQERGEAAHPKGYAEKLKRLAAELWKNRSLFFQSEENLSAKENQTRQEVLQTRPERSFLRGFRHQGGAIFEGTTTAAEAQAK